MTPPAPHSGQGTAFSARGQGSNAQSAIGEGKTRPGLGSRWRFQPSVVPVQPSGIRFPNRPESGVTSPFAPHNRVGAVT